MKNQALRSAVLVIVQLTCIGLLLLTGPIVARYAPALAMQLLAVGLGLWALGCMSRGVLRIGPDVHHEARLITDGPYRWIRHPMYTSVLLYTLACLLDYFSALRFGIWLILLVDLLVKLRIEERLLGQRFESYADYTRGTKRLIPFIYGLMILFPSGIS